MRFESTMVLDIGENRSSLIRQLEYDEENHALIVRFRKKLWSVLFIDVWPNHFEEFTKQPSIGKYYLHYIKPNFKQKTLKMSDNQRPPTKNQASDQKRFIKISINVRDINKSWLIDGEKGTYLGMTLQMLPDGQLDRFGNLGMVTQDVPKEIYEKEKSLPKVERTQGAILGNAAEFAWEGKLEGQPGVITGKLHEEGVADDLPF